VGEVLDNPPRKSVGDGRQREDVRRFREQELASHLVCVEASLDRQEQLGRALDLVDCGRPGDVGDETRGVRACCARGGVIVKADQARGVVLRDEVGDQRALADLSRAEQRHSPAIAQRLQEITTDVSLKQAADHAPYRSFAGRQIMNRGPASL